MRFIRPIKLAFFAAVALVLAACTTPREGSVSFDDRGRPVITIRSFK